MENLFHSRRLTYRAIEDPDHAFLHSIQSDIVGFSMSHAHLLKPMPLARSKEYLKFLQEKPLLAVIICLRSEQGKTVESTSGTASASASVTAATHTARSFSTEGANTQAAITAPGTDSATASTVATPSPTPTPIGVIYLNAIADHHHRASYISINIVGGHQRRGYGSEAIGWIVDWGFRMAGLHRIGIEAFGWNPGARRLYERLGFVYEGMKREEFWYDGKWWGILSLGMLEGEWRERRRRAMEEGDGKEEKR